MSELLRQVDIANQKNRQNIDVARKEFAGKLADLARGIPMKVTRYQDCYVALKDGKAKIVKNSS